MQLLSQQASLQEPHSFASHPLTALLSSPVLYFAFEMAEARPDLLFNLPITQLAKKGVPSLGFYMLSLCLPSLQIWSPFLGQHSCQSS